MVWKLLSTQTSAQGLLPNSFFLWWFVCDAQGSHCSSMSAKKWKGETYTGTLSTITWDSLFCVRETDIQTWHQDRSNTPIRKHHHQGPFQDSWNWYWKFRISSQDLLKLHLHCPCAWQFYWSLPPHLVVRQQKWVLLDLKPLGEALQWAFSASKVPTTESCAQNVTHCNSACGSDFRCLWEVENRSHQRKSPRPHNIRLPGTEIDSACFESFRKSFCFIWNLTDTNFWHLDSSTAPDQVYLCLRLLQAEWPPCISCHHWKTNHQRHFPTLIHH